MSSRPVSNGPITKDPQGNKKQIASEEDVPQWGHVLRSYLNKIMIEVVKSFLEIIIVIIKSLPKIIKSSLINPITTIQILLLLILIFKLRQIINWLYSIFSPIHTLGDALRDIAAGIAQKLGAGVRWVGDGIAHGASAVGHGLGHGVRALGHGAVGIGHGITHGASFIGHGLGGGARALGHGAVGLGHGIAHGVSAVGHGLGI
ncbi:MAG: hypothetical protein OXH24_07955 [Cyanobacteria bacterium MAG IRC3_bin_20]|nr:hypothetical protein [Cyanobacteria bacterium MAG IRC3_bin_20]